MTEQVSTQATGDRAGFGQRLAAVLIDSLILAVPSVILLIILPAELYYVLSTLIGAAYVTYFEGGAGQTIGKRALGIVVTDLTGGRISFGRATGRYFAFFLSDITLGLGYLIQPFTRKRQALHDLIAGTLVVGT